MKPLIITLLAVMLTGCATVVAAPKFPDRPPALSKDCEELSLLAENAKLSDLLKVVTENYVKYHICKNQNKAWNSWYDEQKKIYQSAIK